MAGTPTFSNRDPNHPQYFVRQFSQGLTVAGTTVVGARLLAPNLIKAHDAVVAIVTAGSTTTSALDFISITGTGGTTTTTVASLTVSTATANSTFTQGFLDVNNFATALQRGEFMYVTSRADATLVAAIVWEYGQPENSTLADPGRHL